MVSDPLFAPPQASVTLHREAPLVSASTPPVDHRVPVRGVGAVQGQLVAVGSANPVKVNAAGQVFAEVYGPHVRTCSVVVPSGVSDQPMSTKETLQGALARATCAARRVNADYGVGLEGGLTLIEGRWYCIGWVAVVDWAGESWTAPASGVPVPQAVMRHVLDDGLELGDAEDLVFGRTNSKQNGGLIGIITDERISRLENFRHPLLTAVCAMRMDRRASYA